MRAKGKQSQILCYAHKGIGSQESAFFETDLKSDADAAVVEDRFAVKISDTQPQPRKSCQ